jgi:hypothetical protein
MIIGVPPRFEAARRVDASRRRGNAGLAQGPYFSCRWGGVLGILRQSTAQPSANRDSINSSAAPARMPGEKRLTVRIDKNRRTVAPAYCGATRAVPVHAPNTT